MRSLMASMLIVAVCGVGCAPSDLTGEPQTQASVPAPLGSNTGRVPGPSPNTAQPQPPLNAALTRRARSALAMAGVTGLRTMPGYENELNTSIEGLWRNHPVQAYVVPTASISGGDRDDERTTVARRRIGGRTIDVVVGEDSSIRMLKFTLGSDTWLLASLSRNGATSNGRRTAALVENLLRD